MKMFGLRSTSTSADIFDVAWNRSVSITSTLFRFTHSHQWPDWPALLGAFFLFAAIIAVVIAICRARGVAIFQPRAEPGARMATLEWATLIVLALVFSPQTTARHMVLMSLVYVVAVAVLLAQREKQSKIILIAAIAFMVGALTLPFGNSASQAVWTWREIGGASWCAILFLLALVWIGSLAARQHVDLSGDKITPDPDPSSRSRP
jgi:hypothetical protein